MYFEIVLENLFSFNILGMYLLYRLKILKWYFFKKKDSNNLMFLNSSKSIIYSYYNFD